jgi:hypothetical protein
VLCIFRTKAFVSVFRENLQNLHPNGGIDLLILPA